MQTKAKTTRAKKKEEELPFKITDHQLVPQHELMPPDEAAATLKRYNASPHEFPFILPPTRLRSRLVQSPETL